MPDRPLAYFLTWTCYGTWLHGDERGSVDMEHNEVDTPLLSPDESWQGSDRARLAHSPYHLDERRREIILAAIQEVCRYRTWILRAAHVRLTFTSWSKLPTLRRNA